MKLNEPAEYQADVVIIGFGSAGGCAAIEARDFGAEVLILEKQPEDTHYSNTRMSGGGFHSPDPAGDFDSLKAYAKAMFSGDNLPDKLEGDQSEFADELAELWAQYAPQNAAFMRGLDPGFQAVVSAAAAFPEFPGAAKSGYACVRSTYTGKYDEDAITGRTKDSAKSTKQSGEAFHACMLTGVQSRNVPIHVIARRPDLLDALDGCLQSLRRDQRELVVDYYRESGRPKSDRRRDLAQRLGITVNALAIRVYRIRETLTACMESRRADATDASCVGHYLAAPKPCTAIEPLE